MPMQLREEHRHFLNRRGITDKIIEDFSIQSADVPLLKLRNALLIPVRHIDGSPAFFKYRRDPMEGDVKPKYLYQPGSKIMLFGADKLMQHRSENVFMTQGGPVVSDRAEFKEMKLPPLIAHAIGDGNGGSPAITEKSHKPMVVLTEGELDALVCWSRNIPAVSSTGGAQSFQEEWVELLARFEVYVCFDNDEAGHKGVVKVLDYLPEAYVVFVPNHLPGVKDISDYVAHGGDLHALLRTARQYRSVDDVLADKQQVAARWGDYTFHNIYLEHQDEKRVAAQRQAPALPAEIGNRKDRAKSVDCLSLLPFRKAAGRYPVTECLWHNDHDPSLTYYKRTNSCFCHVCGKYADAIDIVMTRDRVNFKRALDILLNE